MLQLIDIPLIHNLTQTILKNPSVHKQQLCTPETASVWSGFINQLSLNS